MGAARAEPGSNPSQDPNRGGQRRPRGRSAPRCPCSRTSQDRVQTTTLVQSHEWPQNRAGACDVNALNGRAKAHKLWVLPGPIPSGEKLHLQAATGPSRTPHPQKGGTSRRPVPNRSNLARKEPHCALRFLTQTPTEKTHPTQRHGGHSPAVADIWHEDKLTPHSPRSPERCWASLCQLRKGVCLGSGSSSLIRAPQESLSSH